jgi:hypothetical protein
MINYLVQTNRFNLVARKLLQFLRKHVVSVITLTQ